MAGFEHYAWLMKSEPSEVSVDDVLGMKDCKVGWFGVRNYQARNFMRDLCKIGDPVLFYHSSCAQPGIVGIGEIASEPYPDPTQFDETSEYFDAKSTQAKPRWVQVDVHILHKVKLAKIFPIQIFKFSNHTRGLSGTHNNRPYGFIRLLYGIYGRPFGYRRRHDHYTVPDYADPVEFDSP